MKLIVFGLLAALVLSPLSANAKGNLSCQFVKPIVETIVSQHLVTEQFNTNLQVRTIEQFIKSMDSAKLYFLKADVEQIRKDMGDFYNALNKRDCTTLEKVRKLYVERVTEREAFAKKYLGESFKIDKTAKMDLDSDKRDFVATKEQLDKLSADYLQFQVASFVATEMSLKESKDLVRRRYERATKNIKEESIEDTYVAYLDAAARSLDPHTSYLSQESLEDFEISMRLSLEGIGATLSSQDGYTVIEQLVKGGAAEKSGKLQTQDKIVAVGQGEKGEMEAVIDMQLKDVVRLIRGKKDTKVRLSVLRKEGGKTQQFNVILTRQKVALDEEGAKIHYVDRNVGGKKMKLGVIDLPSFYADTKRGGRSSAKDVKKLLAEARKNKADGIVLDLASNGGGSLEDAVSLAGLFFKKGNVVSTQGRKAESADVLSDEDSDVDWSGPLVVLTSRLSASASEIVAGALKDYKRAVIVGGDHTFGKGSVQSVVTLPNNLGAIKVTVGMFYIPGGKSTQHQGVDADIVLPGAFNRDEVGEKSLDYSLPPKQIKAFVSEAAAVTSGPDAWKPITTEMVTELKKSSEKRVEQNEDFKKVKAELDKAIAKGKVVTVAEVLDKKEETKENEKKRKARQKDANLRTEEYLKRADLQEAASVLADLVVAQQKQNVIATGSGLKTEKNN